MEQATGGDHDSLCPTREALDLYNAGELGSGEARELERHLHACAACRLAREESMAFLAGIDQALARSASPGLTAAVERRLARPETRRPRLRIAVAAAIAALAFAGIVAGAYELGRRRAAPPSTGEPQAQGDLHPEDSPRIAPGEDDEREERLPEGGGAPEGTETAPPPREDTFEERLEKGAVSLAEIEKSLAVEEGGAALPILDVLGPLENAGWRRLLAEAAADPALVPAVVSRLSRAENPPDPELLASLARSDDPRGRRLALALAVGLSGARAAVPYLADADPGVSAEAAHLVGADYAADWALELAADLASEDPARRELATLALRVFQAEAASRDLAAALSDSKAGLASRVAAARALAVLGRAEAIEPLLAQLGSSPPELELACASAAKELTNERNTPVLLGLLDSTQPRVRREAVRLLASLPGEAHRAALFSRAAMTLDSTSPDEILLAAALENLPPEGDPAARELVEKASRSASDSVRRIAIHAMARAQPGSWRVRLEEMLQDPEPSLGRHALLVLRLHGDRESFAAILASLSPEDEEYDRLAFRALLALDQEKALAAARALSGPDGGPGWAAAMELAELYWDVASEKEILRAAASGKPEVRARALEILALRRHEEAVPAAERAIRAEAPEIRAAAARALGLAGGERALVLLSNAVRDETPAVRIEACRALARLDTVEGVPALVQALSDRSRDVQLAAAESLRLATGRLGEGDPPAGGPELALYARRWLAWYDRHDEEGRARWLADALRSEDPRERLLAARAFATLGAPAAVREFEGALAALSAGIPEENSLPVRAPVSLSEEAAAGWLELASSSDPRVRLWAAKQLAAAGSAAGVEALARLARDGDPDLAETAARALLPYAEQRALNALVALLSGTDDKVRRERISSFLSRATGLVLESPEAWPAWWEKYRPLYR